MKNIDIIFEDNDLIIIDKPYGVVVNRSNTTPEGTVQDFIEENYSLISSDEEFISRSGIVHRIDKDTSGVLIASKNETSFLNLKHQFQSREVIKEYVAIVMGEVKDQRLEINAPIKRNPNIPMKFAVVEGGKNALTIVEKDVLIHKGDMVFTRVKAFPKTGRTHQIRVHLSAISHPIAGDVIYLTRHNFELCDAIYPRLMLHANKVTFKHPSAGELVTYISPLPGEFNN